MGNARAGTPDFAGRIVDLSARVTRAEGDEGVLFATGDVDGTAAGSVEPPLYTRMISSFGPSITYDHGSSVPNLYEAPFTLTGKLHDVVIQLINREDPVAAKAEARAEMNHQ